MVSLCEVWGSSVMDTENKSSRVLTLFRDPTRFDFGFNQDPIWLLDTGGFSPKNFYYLDFLITEYNTPNLS